jgi:heat shock protein HslJ
MRRLAAVAVVFHFVVAPLPVHAEDPPSMDRIANSRVNGVPEAKGATLKDGLFEGKPSAKGGASRPRVLLLKRLTATGSLDGKAGDERAVLLSGSAGGSGENIYLALYGWKSGKAENLATVLVGDRVQLRALEVEGDTIVLHVVEQGPGEPMCCPTQLARVTYNLRSGKLKRTGKEVTGTLTAKFLEGAEWRLDELTGLPLPAGTTPPTLRLEGEKVFGFAGCNRYVGRAIVTGPATLAFGPLAMAKMICGEPQMAVESNFVHEMSRVTRFSFAEGRLALSWADSTGAGSLYFVR